LELLKRIDKGESATKLALEFGVGKATISDWKKESFSASSRRSILYQKKITDFVKK
jgi:phage portal protein BeeE